MNQSLMKVTPRQATACRVVTRAGPGDTFQLRSFCYTYQEEAPLQLSTCLKDILEAAARMKLLPERLIQNNIPSIAPDLFFNLVPHEEVVVEQKKIDTLEGSFLSLFPPFIGDFITQYKNNLRMEEESFELRSEEGSSSTSNQFDRETFKENVDTIYTNSLLNSIKNLRFKILPERLVGLVEAEVCDHVYLDGAKFNAMKKNDTSSSSKGNMKLAEREMARYLKIKNKISFCPKCCIFLAVQSPRENCDESSCIDTVHSMKEITLNASVVEQALVDPIAEYIHMPLYLEAPAVLGFREPTSKRYSLQQIVVIRKKLPTFVQFSIGRLLKDAQLLVNHPFLLLEDGDKEREAAALEAVKQAVTIAEYNFTD